jgi:hypothetical protein
VQDLADHSECAGPGVEGQWHRLGAAAYVIRSVGGKDTWNGWKNSTTRAEQRPLSRPYLRARDTPQMSKHAAYVETPLKFQTERANTEVQGMPDIVAQGFRIQG